MEVGSIINFGDQLKSLRKQKGVTQEELASFLGITFQAVSKWERGEGLPEISLLPLIADFFCITIDELLGSGSEKSKQEVEKCLRQGSLYFNKMDFENSAVTLRGGLREYVNSYELMCALLSVLTSQYPQLDEQGKTECDNEIISLGNRLIFYCTDDILRFRAKEALCRHYSRNLKNNQKANEFAKTMPAINFYHQLTMAETYDGEERIAKLQSLIKDHARALDEIINVLLMYDETLSHYDKIKLITAANTVYETLFEAGDYDYNCITGNYTAIALQLVKLGDYDGTLKMLEKVVDGAIAYDETIDGTPQKSLLFNRLVIHNKEFDNAIEQNEMKGIDLSRYVLDYTLHGNCFRELAERDSFKTLEARLVTYLKEKGDGAVN